MSAGNDNLAKSARRHGHNDLFRGIMRIFSSLLKPHLTIVSEHIISWHKCHNANLNVSDAFRSFIKKPKNLETAQINIVLHLVAYSMLPYTVAGSGATHQMAFWITNITKNSFELDFALCEDSRKTVALIFDLLVFIAWT